MRGPPASASAASPTAPSFPSATAGCGQSGLFNYLTVYKPAYAGQKEVTSSPNNYSLYTKSQYDANYSSGRTRGQNDVKNSPNSYSLYTKSQYDANYSSGRIQGQNDVKNSPNSYSLYTKAQYDANYNAGSSANGGYSIRIWTATQSKKTLFVGPL